jgi:hypothetical protein
MKTLVLIAAMYFSADFCKGWENGYCEGWRYVKGVDVVCPVAPVCPTPDYNRTTYNDGYNKGYRAGSKAAKEE